jgi:hypothetical protein
MTYRETPGYRVGRQPPASSQPSKLLRRLPTFDPPEAALKQRRSLRRSLGRTRCESLGVADSRFSGVEFAAFSPVITATCAPASVSTDRLSTIRC